MTSLICPKCGKHITDWDLACLNCDYVISPEERARLRAEHEKLISSGTIGKDHFQARSRKHPIQRKLNRLSFGIFSLGWPEMVVPIVAVLMIVLLIFFMVL
jgi:hypothetical protein